MADIATTKLSSKGQVVIPEEVRNKLKLKPGAVFKTLRVALTGETQGVSLDLLIDVIGKEAVIRRLKRFLSLI